MAMSRTRRIALTALTSIALLAVGLATQASARRGGHGRGGGPLMNAPMEKVAERLQLTDEQAAQVEAIRSRFKADAEASRTEMKAMRKEMKALWKAPDGPDRPAILARFEAMHALKGQLKRMAINARLDIMELLTPEQREQAAQARRRGRRGRGAGRGDRRGPPEEGGEWMD